MRGEGVAHMTRRGRAVGASTAPLQRWGGVGGGIGCFGGGGSARGGASLPWGLLLETVVERGRDNFNGV